MKIKFIRFSPDAKIPIRKYESDTGADIFMPHSGIVEAHQTVVIPCGFGVDTPNGYTARLQVRTSIAIQGVMIQGCAIDSGYTGEIHIILHNISSRDFRWEKDSRLCYIEVYPTQYPIFVEDENISTREKNAFGSTGI